MDQNQAGVLCALWTPLDEQFRVDTRLLRTTLEFVLEQKVHGVMALGSTGEFLHLTTAQRKEVFQTISEGAPGKPLIANISHVRPRDAFDLGLHAKQHGAQMIALLPPWFYPMSQEDIAEFFIKIAEEVRLPLAIYNFPEMTGKKVELATIRAVAKRVPVRAVKQSGGDFAYHRELGELARELNFALFTGADTHFPEAAELGATGIVSGLSNAVPEVVLRTYTAVTAGKADTVERERKFLGQMADYMGRIAFPLNIKSAMEARGIATGLLKSPISAETRRTYESFVAELRAFYSSARMF